VTMTKDSSFSIALKNTILFTACTIPVMLVLAICLAVLLNSGIKGKGYFRMAFFFPYISSVVAISVVWQFIYQPDFGPINFFLRSIGIQEPPRWLSSRDWAMPALIIMRIWQITGYYMIIFTAGLHNIPKHL